MIKIEGGSNFKIILISVTIQKYILVCNNGDSLMNLFSSLCRWHSHLSHLISPFVNQIGCYPTKPISTHAAPCCLHSARMWTPASVEHLIRCSSIVPNQSPSLSISVYTYKKSPYRRYHLSAVYFRNLTVVGVPHADISGSHNPLST